MASFEGLGKQYIDCFIFFLATLDKPTVLIELYFLCFRLKSQKLFIISLLHEKRMSPGTCQTSLQVKWWRKRRWRMERCIPETGCTQSHCLIKLSMQSTLLNRQGQGSNQFNMVAGRGQLLSGCSPNTNKSKSGLDTWDAAQFNVFFFPCWKITVLLCENFTLYLSLCHDNKLSSGHFQVKWLVLWNKYN